MKKNQFDQKRHIWVRIFCFPTKPKGYINEFSKTSIFFSIHLVLLFTVTFLNHQEITKLCLSSQFTPQSLKVAFTE